jgi:hypothetical protein
MKSARGKKDKLNTFRVFIEFGLGVNQVVFQPEKQQQKNLLLTLAHEIS